METIYIVSLSKHRIDELLANYAAQALESLGYDIVRDLPTTLATVGEKDKLLVFNGVKDGSVWCEKVITAMSVLDSYYFLDDHTCWVPDVDCTVISQFVNLHPKNKNTKKNWKHWPISRLGNLMPSYTNNNKEYDFVYWGHYKPERKKYYRRHIPICQETLIIGDAKEWPAEFHQCTFIPYERDMHKLYCLISSGKDTVVFGDKYHNNNNLPLRYYEAIKCGLLTGVDSDLANPDAFLELTGEEIGKQLCHLINIYSDEKGKVLDTPFNPSHTTSNVDEVLEQRGQIYGSYNNGVKCRAEIMNSLKEIYTDTHSGDGMPQELQIMYGDLVLKLMRSASDPSHLDSWVDLAGYSKLIKETMESDYGSK